MEDYADDHYYHGHYDDDWAAFAVGVTVGAAISAASYQSLECDKTVFVVEGVSYYQCGDAVYQRQYQGGDVTYVVVEPPSGK